LCYANAALQILSRLPLAAPWRDLLDVDVEARDRTLPRFRAWLRTKFAPGQQDAHEFVLELCQDVGAMALQYVTTLTCVCGHTRDIRDSSLGLSLGLGDEGPKTLKHLLQLHFRTEVLPDIACDACHTRQPTVSRGAPLHWPPILMVHLKRFECLDVPRKRHDPVQHPRVLLLGPHRYERCGVIFHHGSVKAGHYTSAVLHSTSPYVWLSCDDTAIRVLSHERLVEQDASYMVFYLQK